MLLALYIVCAAICFIGCFGELYRDYQRDKREGDLHRISFVYFVIAALFVSLNQWVNPAMAIAIIIEWRRRALVKKQQQESLESKKRVSYL